MTKTQKEEKCIPKNKRINKVLLALYLLCCMTAEVIKANAKSVRDEMEFLFREPQNDIFAPITEIAVQILEIVGIGAVIVIIVVGLVWLIKKIK